MLINLINTILIACGMAVNTSNFTYEKKTHKNAEQYVEETLTYNSTPNQQIVITEDTTTIQAKKYILPNHNTIASYLQDTVYTYVVDTDNVNPKEQYVYGIYKIKNRYSSNINYNLTVKFTQTNWTYYNLSVINATNADIDQYYNMTLTSNSFNQMQNLYTEARTNGTILNEGGDYTITGIGEKDITLSTNGIALAVGEEYEIYFQIHLYYNNIDTATGIDPDSFSYHGLILVPDSRQEIVNVPGMMLTILTLPFSFISQAFDLTIFPNTNYALNFSNLFRTIIAIFVLLWLIKKIFK